MNATPVFRLSYPEINEKGNAADDAAISITPNVTVGPASPEADGARLCPNKVRKTGRKTSGSNIVFTPEEMDRIPELERQAGFLLGTRAMEQVGTHHTCLVDMVLFMLTMRFVADHPNDGEHNPVARHKALHAALQASGLLPDAYERAWHHERYQACRNYFDNLGFVTWTNSSYVAPTWTTNGKKIPGLVCCWTLDLSAIESVEQRPNWIPNPNRTPVRPTRIYPLRIDRWKEVAEEFEQWDRQRAG